MYGALQVDTIQSGTGGPPAIKNSAGQVIGETCRARAYIDTTAAVAVALSSFNVSSITDNGVGDVTVTFAVALPGANYTAAGIVRHVGGSYFSSIIENAAQGHVRTAGAHRVMAMQVPNSGAVDGLISIAHFGG